MSKYETICDIWKNYNIDNVNTLENHLDSFKIIFAYHSGKIENDEITYDDTREVFESGTVTHFTGSLRTIFEIQNQKICYEFLKEKIVDKEPLSIDLIKKIHKRLARGTYDDRRYNINMERPGEYKKHDYVTGPNEVGSFPDEVPEDMDYLVQQINSYSGDPLFAAAYLHACFENIHPFADANGRTGRTIMNYYLMINDHPPIVIYDEDKHAYFQALRAFDENDDLAPLQKFLKSATEKSWMRLLKEKETQPSFKYKSIGEKALQLDTNKNKDKER